MQDTPDTQDTGLERLNIERRAVLCGLLHQACTITKGKT